MAIEDSGNSSTWSREQEKAFENALADYSNEDSNHRWEKIAADVPGKTVDDIKKHFELLMEDINGIESGRVPLPYYISSSGGSIHHRGLPYYISSSGGSIHHRGDGGKKVGNHHSDSHTGGKPPRSEQERRRGIAWTEDEHRLFLLGLEKYGKGDWRSISRNFVLSRTPTQVASHAQKYFIRLNSMNKDRRRSSIHDITSICSGESSATQEPITGTSGTTVVPSRRPGKQPPNHPPAIAGVGIYGTPTIGQPTRAPIASAVGTPVHVPAQPCIAYDGRGPAVGKVVSSASSIPAPSVYPMQHASAHSHR